MRAQTVRDRQGAVLALLVFALVVPLYGLPPVTAEPVAVPPPPLPVAAASTTTSPSVLHEISAGAPSTRAVALTFDDGPDPRWTPRVLDLLTRYDAVATFCLVGENSDRHEDVVRQVVEAGMRLCNHTRTHDLELPTRPDATLAREVVDTRSDLASRSGARVPYFRAPGGNWVDRVAGLAAEHGMRPLGWSVDSGDWRTPDAAQIVRRVQEQIHPGAIVLLHDGGGQRDQTVAALEQLLPWLVENCYAFTFPTP